MSGFLAFSVPAMITGFSERWRLFWLTGQPADLKAAAGASYELWRFLALTYFATVVLGASFILWRRRNETSIYNVLPPVLEEVLLGVLHAQGILYSRSGNRFFLRLSNKAVPVIGEEASEAIQAAPSAPWIRESDLDEEPVKSGEREAGLRRSSTPATATATAYLQVIAAPLLRHVILRWECAGECPIRHRIEMELGRMLADVRTRANPVGGWLILTGGLLLFLAAVAFATVVLRRILEGY
jgi:hypothetical protein